MVPEGACTRRRSGFMQRVAGFIFIKARLPETKGKTLEEIESSWQ